ncbi:hypothetical protein GCM10010971_17830 [Silvimonas amylolytica]|uniref:Uncharacterized protein n=1 Tax=Silvimonas amylolytica TaxID=449663 RepID=A0ABQ2PLW2_9NEIS|nr:hypothetical protein GCM10010971_17830 [Silvimonas amylolytica]
MGRQKKGTKEKRPLRRRPLRGFPALLAKSGWLQGTRAKALKHPYAETPDFTAMLGAVKGRQVKSNCNPANRLFARMAW